MQKFGPPAPNFDYEWHKPSQLNRTSSIKQTEVKFKLDCKKMAEPTPSPTPNRAVYGFAWFLFFKTLFVLYVCWALLPEYILHDVLGLTYLPDKYFALFLPILVLCALTVFAFLVYPPWNMSMQDDINDLHTLRDKHTIVRCQHLNQSTGKRCENNVEPIKSDASNNFNRWLFEKYCSIHIHMDATVENESDDCRIDDTSSENEFCDCVNKSKCFLYKHPKHLKVLQRRSTVPNACDLYAGDVCKELFLQNWMAVDRIFFFI